MTIRSLSDIEEMEAIPLASRDLPASTYAAIAAATARTPDARALTYIPDAKRFDRAFTWTYSDLPVEITRAANAFRNLGVTAENPVAYVLPNLPETHFTIWVAKRQASPWRSIHCSSRRRSPTSCASPGRGFS